jgi:KipI family sensor histidine kinase inhibitor
MDGAALLELPNASAQALAAHLRTTRPPGFLEAVPGAQTLLVLFDPARFDLSLLSARPPATALQPRTVRLATVYDGPDLAALSAQLGLDAARAHASAEHVVQFLGFAPGFAYCSGGFAVPRLATPRVRVPAGSVAVADGYTGIYPAATPGGWWLVGRVAEPMFDPNTTPPSLLTPGDRVVFEQVESLPPAHQVAQVVQLGEPLARVVKASSPATVQGGPRYGFAQFGVPAGGAMDLAALAATNALVGNAPLAAAIEFALVSPALEALAPLRVAVGGSVYSLQKGDTLPAQKISALRGYLAVEGGLAPPPPGAPQAPLAAGNVLYKAEKHPELPRALPQPGEPGVLRVVPGPQWGWFAAPEQLFETEWRLSPQTDRRGARLEGTKLTLTRPSDLPPEGTAPGAVQVPGDGQPIVLGPDRPVTGGYAKIATVLWDDLPLLAQARPGARIRFVRHR